MSDLDAIPRQRTLQPSPSGRLGASMARVRLVLGDRSGAAAVEFALVSGLLITAILMVMTVGLLLFMGQAMDHATDVAARQIKTGAVQKQGMSQSTFVSNVVCPALPATFNCNNVIVNVQTVPEAAGPAGYYAFVNSTQTSLIMPTLSNTAAQYNPGLQGGYIYLQIVYPVTILPKVLANILGTTTFKGAPAYLITSTAAFRNEQY